MLLTIEDHPEQGTVELHADREGLAYLIGMLTAMRDRELPPDIQARIGLDHDHYFSPAWGGDGLTDFVPIGVNGTGADGTIVHHLKVYKWPGSPTPPTETGE